MKKLPGYRTVTVEFPLKPFSFHARILRSAYRMKRIQEKVKDIVEVRPYNSICDFTADRRRMLLNYHFTDATADLMAKWLDGTASVQGGKGTASARAGYRGVGKSYFLAALGASAANPEIRMRVSESHVAFSAQRLQRRHYTVAYLRRAMFKTCWTYSDGNELGLRA